MAISNEQRSRVAERAVHCCEYCRSQLKYSADSFSVEHVLPNSLDGDDDDSNLALACQGCNNRKFTAIEAIDPLTGQPVPLFYPRTDDWSEHFAWSDDFVHVYGLTPIGRATVERLQLNRAGLANLRRILRQAGEHPPS